MRRPLVQIMAVVLVTGLILTVIGSGVVVVAVREGIAPDFDQRIALDARHILVIHNGPRPTCTVLPTPHSTIASGQIWGTTAVTSPCLI